MPMVKLDVKKKKPVLFHTIVRYRLSFMAFIILHRNNYTKL